MPQNPQIGAAAVIRSRVRRFALLDTFGRAARAILATFGSGDQHPGRRQGKSRGRQSRNWRPKPR